MLPARRWADLWLVRTGHQLRRRLQRPMRAPDGPASDSGQRAADIRQWTVHSGQWTTDRRRVCVGVCVCACVRERGRGRRTTRRTGTGCQGVAADGASRQLSGRAPASAAGQRSGAAGALPVVATVPQPACLPLPPTGLPGCPAAPAAGLSPARSMPVARPPPRTLSAQPVVASSPATWRARAAAPAAPMMSCTMVAGRAPAPPRQQAAAPTEQSLLAAAPEQRLPSTSTRLSSPSSASRCVTRRANGLRGGERSRIRRTVSTTHVLSTRRV